MKKIISLTLISSVALMLITGCGGSGPSSHDQSIGKNALYVKQHNNEKLIKSIEKAGEASGWKITKFKSNSVIAEKVDGDTTYSSTLKFSNGYVDFENAQGTSDGDLDNLRDAIKEETKENSSH